MRRALTAVALFLCGSLVLAGTGASYSLDIDIAPDGEAGSYTCKAVVADLETGIKVLSAPFVRFTTASPARMKTTDGDLVSELNVSVDSKTSRATAELKVSRAGKVVAAQKLSVAVR